MILGISGKQGAGKDTLGIILRDLLKPQKWVRRGFGDSIKEMYADIHHLSLEEIEKFKDAHRPGLQMLGDEMRRMFPTIWIDKLQEKREPNENTIITDVRYLNEKEYVENRGHCIRIVSDVKRREIVGEAHVSEVELDDAEFFYTFVNNGSLQDLKNEAIKFLHEYKTYFNKSISGW